MISICVEEGGKEAHLGQPDILPLGPRSLVSGVRGGHRTPDIESVTIRLHER
jgi:hypothetical protein